MREILFRGKTTRTKMWVYGHYSTNYGTGRPEIREKAECCFTEVIPETVGQYIGLTDKNGKKIFEGDIVRADDYIFSVKYGKCGGVENAETYGYMGFYLEAVSEGTKLCAKYGLRDDMCYFTDIKVIGNIYDNPEFLSRGE